MILLKSITKRIRNKIKIMTTTNDFWKKIRIRLIELKTKNNGNR